MTGEQSGAALFRATDRRRFLQSAAAVIGHAVVGGVRLRARQVNPGRWRTYEISTNVRVLRPSGVSRVWLPAALSIETPYQRTLGNEYRAPGGQARLDVAPNDGLAIVCAEFPEGVAPHLSLVSRVDVRAHALAVTEPKSVGANRTLLAHFLRPTRLIPTDGIVRARALEITSRVSSDIDRARAIYDWIVENTFRDPKVQGCGLGDIRFMLESGNLGGKCADLNALFVGLCRAIGLPARDVYGLRVAPSEHGFRSLGASSATVTRAQHCRAEVFLDGYGWVPVDPADVRKAALEEPPGNRGLHDEVIQRVRNQLFGSWEMNWIAYNFAHDVVLPGSSRAAVPFLMYPQGETAQGRLDSLDADAFRYEINAREIEGP
jgi:transglutaminase-like putative cysteine protease